MSLDWHVGMKVVCVDAKKTGRPSELEQGRVYELAEITTNAKLRFPVRGPYAKAVVLVRLKGVDRILMGAQWDCPFAAARFRPVQEKKTDIGVFTELLTPAGQNKRIREDA